MGEALLFALASNLPNIPTHTPGIPFSSWAACTDCLEMQMTTNSAHVWTRCLNLTETCLINVLAEARGTGRPTWLATTASCGSSGSAAARRACNDRRTVLRVMAAALEEHPGERYSQKNLCLKGYRKIQG